jgi:hypothetical protein
VVAAVALLLHRFQFTIRSHSSLVAVTKFQHCWPDTSRDMISSSTVILSSTVK